MNTKPLGKNPLGKKSKLGGIAVLVLAGIYSLAAPQLNKKFGWDLPAIASDAQGNVRLADKDSNKPVSRGPLADKMSDSTSSSNGSDLGKLDREHSQRLRRMKNRMAIRVTYYTAFCVKSVLTVSFRRKDCFTLREARKGID